MENLIKNYPFVLTPIQYFIVLLLYVQCSLLMGLAASPGVILLYNYWLGTEAWLLIPRLIVFSILLCAAYFIYAITLIFVIGLVRNILRLKVKEGRFFVFSWDAIQWANYNSLILIVRYTCMNFLRVTPLLNLFYRMMGAKIGRNVQINTTILSDCSILEIGNNTVIGGDVTLIGHVAERDQLIVKRVKIGSNVTLGLMSIVMPGVTIGDHTVIAANSVIKKDTQIPSQAVWGGIPARSLRSS